jgi:hypothetical protein
VRSRRELHFLTADSFDLNIKQDKNLFKSLQVESAFNNDDVSHCTPPLPSFIALDQEAEMTRTPFGPWINTRLARRSTSHSPITNSLTSSLLRIKNKVV